MPEEKKEEKIAEPVYILTDEYRPEDQGQKLPKNRMIEKTFPQVYNFSYQDVHTMVAKFKGEIEAFEGEKREIERLQKKAQDQLALWEKELEYVEAHFPELKVTSADPVPSPFVQE